MGDCGEDSTETRKMDYIKSFEQNVPGEKKYPNMPFIHSPFTKISELYQTHYRGPCGPYELDLHRCLARTGAKRGETECKMYIEDFKECVWQPKTLERYRIMQEERKNRTGHHQRLWIQTRLSNSACKAPLRFE